MSRRTGVTNLIIQSLSNPIFQNNGFFETKTHRELLPIITHKSLIENAKVMATSIYFFDSFFR